jgi:hypothetical protein
MNGRFRRIGSKLTYANVISTLCLFLVLGGGAAFAASKLPKNSVGSKQIRKGAISPSKLSPAAVKTLAGDRGKAGARGATGATGPQGPAGPGGAPGGAKAWVQVAFNGSVIKGVGPLTVSKIQTSPGEYCISGGPYTTANSVGLATADWSDPDHKFDNIVQVVNGPSDNFCPLPGEFSVLVFNAETGEFNDAGFTFMIP